MSTKATLALHSKIPSINHSHTLNFQHQCEENKRESTQITIIQDNIPCKLLVGELSQGMGVAARTIANHP